MIRIPQVPPSPNELRRKYRHPQAYRRLRQQWEHDLLYGVSCSRHRNQLTATAKTQRMCVQVIVKHLRLFDADNLAGAQKPILDALKRIGFLKDDSDEHLLLLTPKQHVVQHKDECETMVRIGTATEGLHAVTDVDRVVDSNRGGAVSGEPPAHRREDQTDY